MSIYTDGGAKPNPGKGGYGVVLKCRQKRKELSGGYRKTTNNRMEITAAIRGLEALKKPATVILYTDSRYLVNAMNKGWARRWRRNNWMRTREEPALNADLWARLLKLCDQHNVTFQWVKAHDSCKENNRCDALASKARRQKNLAIDKGFRRSGSR